MKRTRALSLLPKLPRLNPLRDLSSPFRAGRATENKSRTNGACVNARGSITPVEISRYARHDRVHRGFLGRSGEEKRAASPPFFLPLTCPPSLRPSCHFERSEKSPPRRQVCATCLTRSALWRFSLLPGLRRVLKPV